LNETDLGKIQTNLQKYWPLLLFFAAAILFAFNFKLTAFQAFLDEHETLGIFACLAAYILLGVTPIPAEPITLLIVAWKGPLPAIIVAAVGNTAAAMAEYYLGGSIRDVTDFESRKASLPFHLNELPVNSPAFLIFGRMIPGFGTKFVSIAGGVYQVPMPTYLWTALVSNLIGAAFVGLGGYGIIEVVRNLLHL
jgi:uncharacterized membrane protein YdjX (TVP38/TMEM64 family)